MSDNCPVCSAPSGIEPDFDNMMDDDLKCEACDADLEIDYDESFDGETECCYFTLRKKSSNPLPR